MNALTTAPGKITRPDRIADRPKPDWTKIGINNAEPTMPINNTIDANADSENVRFVNTRIFNSGLSILICLVTKMVTIKIPTISEIITIGDVKPKLPALRSEEHTSELQSRFDLVCRLLLEKENLQ